ncbi:MAG: iron-sulfur cluster assembly protein [Halobacteriaceae archaeon]
MAAARDRRGAVRAALDGVTDPELDRSLVDLGYVDEVAVDGGRATVRLTLPTAWCSPAFAWMMATTPARRSRRSRASSARGCTSGTTSTRWN